MIDSERLMQFAKLYRARKKMKAKVDAIGKRLKEMQVGLIENLIENEVDRCAFKNGITIYIDQKIWPQYLAPMPDVIKALRENGHADIINEGLNTHTIASWLRELDAEEKELPEELQKVIKPTIVQNLIAKKH